MAIRWHLCRIRPDSSDPLTDLLWKTIAVVLLLSDRGSNRDKCAGDITSPLTSPLTCFHRLELLSRYYLLSHTAERYFDYPVVQSR